MTKAIKSYPESERKEVVARRIKNPAGGLGTLSAQEALALKGKVAVAQSKEEQAVQ